MRPTDAVGARRPNDPVDGAGRERSVRSRSSGRTYGRRGGVQRGPHGSGTGQLSTLSTTGGQPATATETATVSLAIATATPITTSDDTSKPLRSLALTGTITVTVGDQTPVTLPFTGTLRLTGGTADSPSGVLSITTDRNATGVTTASGFALSGRLSGGSISVSGLVVSDHSNPPGEFVFQSPESRTAAGIKLTRG